MSYPRLFKDLSNDAATILGLISEASGAKPISILAIQSEFDRWGEPITPRRVKAIVSELRRNGQPIGASRGTPHGYYLIESGSEQEHTVRTYRRQILTMWKTLKRIDSTARMREFAGQLTTTLEA